MTFPIKFPNHLDVIRQEAEAFRRLPTHERLRAIFDLISMGDELVRRSPRRGQIAEEDRRYEEAWQRAHREEVQKHGLS